MGARDYKELLVWQKSMVLVKELYRLVKLLPKEEIYSLSEVKTSFISLDKSSCSLDGLPLDISICKCLSLGIDMSVS